MKLKALIDFVDSLKENTFPPETKVIWVNEIEGMIQTEVHLQPLSEVVQYDWTENQETTLIVPPPYDKLYRYYLESMIAFEQEEMDRYRNSQEMFQKCYIEYAGFVADTMHPDGECINRADVEINPAQSGVGKADNLKLSALLELVDTLKPNTFPAETKVVWVNEIEGQIQTEVHFLAIADVVQYQWPDNQDAALLVPPPYDKLYRYYLESMIAFEQEEMDRYQNIQEMFQKCFLEYVGFVASTMHPADGCAERAQYYLSAYALAVKLGYTGTLQEWLESLKGEKGDPFRYEDFTQEQLEDLTEGIQDYATQEAIKAAQEGVEQAAQDAADRVREIVAQDATAAQEAAERAETAATAAESSETAAAESEAAAAAGAVSAAESARAAEQSKNAAQTAGTKAEESARAATASAAAADASKAAAGESASAAEAAAQRAEGAVGKTSYIGENGNWYVWDTVTNAYKDSGRPATALANQNGGGLIRMWFGTVQEYNQLPKIESDVYYNILEGAP